MFSRSAAARTVSPSCTEKLRPLGSSCTLKVMGKSGSVDAKMRGLSHHPPNWKKRRETMLIIGCGYIGDWEPIPETEVRGR